MVAVADPEGAAVAAEVAAEDTILMSVKLVQKNVSAGQRESARSLKEDIYGLKNFADINKAVKKENA